MSEHTSVALLAVRLVLSLGLVVAAVGALVWVIKRKSGSLGLRGRSTSNLEVLERKPLSRTSSVAVVRVGARAMVVGITDSRISVLTEAPELLEEQVVELAADVVELPVAAATATTEGEPVGSMIERARRTGPTRAVDVMVAIGTNFFYTVTLPVTLWFLDKGKAGTEREDTVLFIDARHMFRQVDRAHRDFLSEQIELLANIVRLYRGEDVETVDGSDAALKERFPDGTYVDVPGLCKVATRAEIEAQGWSLNPGRYTGTAAVDDDDEDFTERLAELYEEFTRLSHEADELRARVDAAITGILRE